MGKAAIHKQSKQLHERVHEEVAPCTLLMLQMILKYQSQLTVSGPRANFINYIQSTARPFVVSTPCMITVIIKYIFRQHRPRLQTEAVRATSCDVDKIKTKPSKWRKGRELLSSFLFAPRNSIKLPKGSYFVKYSCTIKICCRCSGGILCTLGRVCHACQIDPARLYDH